MSASPEPVIEAAPPSPLAGKRADAVSVGVASAHVALVLAPVVLAAVWGPGASTPLLAVVFGALMHGLLNLMHEAAHGHVFRARRHSDALGRWLLGPLVVSDFDAYRRRHWDHHRYLGGERDTKSAYLVDLSGAGLLRFALRCAVGLEALAKLRHAAGGAGDASPRWLLRAALVQAAWVGLLLGVAFAARPAGASREALWAVGVAYACVYVWGLVAVTTFVAGLRAVAEHQVAGSGDWVEGRAALRNLRCNALTRLVLGAHGFADHATHHAEPGLPAYRLPARTAEKGREDPRFQPRAGYLAVLAERVGGAA